MILLNAITNDRSGFAVKTPSGILVLSEIHSRFPNLDISFPQTLQAALEEPGGLERVSRDVSAMLSKHKGVWGLMRPESDVRIGLPIRPRSFICVAQNYREHAEEAGIAPSQFPRLFGKLSNCATGPNDPIVLPLDSKEVDYEAELAVVIGRRCQRVRAQDALDYVAGYTCLNDVSARDFQRGDWVWLRAKSQDTFGPIGPYLVTPDEIPDPQNLSIRCWVNEELRQDSNTSNMIFSVRDLIAFISRGITLQLGDVIATGTPHGVGVHRAPPVFLEDGDQITIEVERVGRLSNPVKGES